MKKCSIILLCILCFATSLFVLPVHAAPICFPDVDGDYKITSSDARSLLRCAVQLDDISPEQFTVADCDADGRITAEDARTALRMAVGIDVDPLTQSRIFRSGHFACNGTIAKDNHTTDVYFATDDSSFLLSTDVDFGEIMGMDQTGMVNISYLVTRDLTYMCSSTHRIYTPMTEENLVSMGFNTSEKSYELFDVSDFAFKLSADDEPIATETVLKDGNTVTCFSFKTPNNGIQKHYVRADGSLILVEDCNYRGELTASLSLDSITNNPQDAISVPLNNYEAQSLFNFLLNLLSDSGVEIQ